MSSNATTYSSLKPQTYIPKSPTTLISHFLDALQEIPNNPLYIFSKTNTPNDTIYTYADIYNSAHKIAQHLHSLGIKKGDRVILLLPQNIHFIEAFFACILGGYIAVPCYPPRLNDKNNHLSNVIHDCTPELIITTAQIQKKVTNSIKKEMSSFTKPWLCIDTTSFLSPCSSWEPSLMTEDDTAFLQYTSGSTSTPKGVIVSHKNIIENQRMIQSGFAHIETKLIGVGWLPFYHDMGLIGNILQTLYMKGKCILTSPTDVVRNPLHWLSLISKYKATTSGGPNFMFNLCVDKISANECKQLDLSSWRVAFTGAEPINSKTLDQFSQHFASCGFQKSSFYPCYGMAEATLMISGGKSTETPILKQVDTHLLTQNNVCNSTTNEDSTTLVSSGKAILSTELHIVNPDTKTPLETNSIGEIWIKGPQVCKGYWNNKEKTDQTFNAYLNSGKGPYLRTGDLGFVDEDQNLFITSRLKDLIIINGKNYAPHDIERCIEESHPALNTNACACFSTINAEQKECLIVIAELNRHYLKQSDYTDIINTIQQCINEEHLISADNILLIKPYSLPKTTSGKIKRYASKNAYINNQLNIVASMKQSPTILPQTGNLLETLIIQTLADHNISLQNKNIRTLELSQLGLDSLQRHQLHLSIETKLNKSIDETFFFQKKPLLDLCKELQNTPTKTPSLSKKEKISSFFSWTKQIKKTGLSLEDPRQTASTPTISFSDTPATSFINFSSYNYLGYATHPNVIQAAKKALNQYGLSASSSPLAGGYLELHKHLETSLIQFYGFDKNYGVSLFNSGFSANIGSISALVDSQDTVICDEFTHASIIEGIKLSGATILFFKHNNTTHLNNILQELESSENTLVCVESIYSTQGDFAPLNDIVHICKKHQTKILVDEAHSALISGPNGRGCCEHENVLHDIDYLILTFSKAFGAIGGALIAKQDVCNYVNFHATSRMFSCGLDPAVTAGTIEAIKLSQSKEGLQQRNKLKQNARYLREALSSHFPITVNDSWIIAITYGDEKKSIPIKLFLQKKGLYAGLLQYPAVPKGNAMIRLFVSALHSKKDLDNTITILIELKNNI